ncbi:MAG TPA: response regulator [Candidatus Polarisedimenticolaceae bacterium]|nr:response regulator [Candidatus Polarisedimenticolaceae bacterium]
MARRRALIVDRDRGFSARLRGCLRALGMVVDVAETRRETLDRLAAKPPSIVFIAVERPKKTGFSLFSDVKRALKNVPIVLTTASVPMGEMMLHQKLRLHAELYLDKRGITEAEILATLSGLLRLKLDSSDLAELASTVSRAVALSADRGDDDDEQEDYRPYLSDAYDAAADPPTDAADEDEETGAADDDDGDLDPPPSAAHERADRSLELNQRLHSLTRELERARRAAGSSPFSKEYLELGDALERAEQRLLRLETEVEHARRENDALRTKLIETTRRRTEAERARDEAIDRARDLEQAGDDLRLRVERETEANRAHAEKLAEETGQRVRLEQDHAFAVEKLRERNERERGDAVAQAVAEATQRHELDQARLAAQHAEALAAAERSAEQRLVAEREGLREQAQRATDALHREHAAELARLRDEAVHERQALERQHDERLERTVREHQQALAAAERRHAELLADGARLADEQTARGLDGRDREWHERLDRLREQHATQLERLRRELVEERTSLTDKLYLDRDSAVTLRDAEWEEKLERLRADHAGRLDEIRMQHADKLAELTRAHQTDLTQRDREHARAIERLTGELHRERTRSSGERSDDLVRSESEHAAEIERVEARHQDEIAVLERVHHEQLQDLRAKQTSERERSTAAHTAALDELSERLRRDQRVTLEGKESDWQQRLERLRDEYDTALEAEREQLRTVLEALGEARAAAERTGETGSPTGAVDDGDDVHEERTGRIYRILGRTTSRVSKPGRASQLLRHLAAELDEIGGAGAAEIDMPDVDAAFREDDRPRRGEDA